MEVKFDLGKLKHLKEISMYNHNFYRLPLSIDNCDILFVEWQDDEFEINYYLGTFTKEGMFAEKHLLFGDINGNIDLIQNKK